LRSVKERRGDAEWSENRQRRKRRGEGGERQADRYCSETMRNGVKEEAEEI
jgi:hypothetical protein